MKISTMSIVVGSRACNAKCPFCVSRMTGFEELPHMGDINWHNLNKAVMRAKMGGVTTILLTGKGEPTLYPDQIKLFLHHIGKEFPAIELQTNGLEIGKLAEGKPTRLTEEMLHEWRRYGLDTIALSVVSIHHEHNARVYHPDYPDLENTVSYLHKRGFSVRLCVMLERGVMGNRKRVHKKIQEILDWCKRNEVEQCTVRPIKAAEDAEDEKVLDYTRNHTLDFEQIQSIHDFLKKNGTLLLRLPHGAEVYDVEGQNICLADCLTLDPDPEKMRQLIFYADGRLTYDWQHKGAILLGGRMPGYSE